MYEVETVHEYHRGDADGGTPPAASDPAGPAAKDHLAQAILELIRETPEYAEALRAEAAALDATQAARLAASEHAAAVEKLFALTDRAFNAYTHTG